MEDWASPREYELPEEFRGEDGLGLARKVLSEGWGTDAKGQRGKSPLGERLEDLEFKVCFVFVDFMEVPLIMHML